MADNLNNLIKLRTLLTRARSEDWKVTIIPEEMDILSGDSALQDAVGRN